MSFHVGTVYCDDIGMPDDEPANRSKDFVAGDEIEIASMDGGNMGDIPDPVEDCASKSLWDQPMGVDQFYWLTGEQEQR